ncbi:MAG: hypothetical protein J5743_05860 [Victivallales bacterium]|nr:hypothetical protein [Victivallales bacterium]
MVTNDREALLFWRKSRRYDNLSSADGGSRRAEAFAVATPRDGGTPSFRLRRC